MGLRLRMLHRRSRWRSAAERSARVHIATERNPLVIAVRMPRAAAFEPAESAGVAVRGADGGMVALGELGRLEDVEEQPIYRKDLRRFAMVIADTAGAVRSTPSWTCKSR